MRASSARTWVVGWTHALAALLFAVVALLWASSEASAAAGVSGHFGTLATHAYDAPVHVYDGGAHSVQAHTSEAAPFASLDLAGGAQGMVATVTGPLSVVSSKSVAANTASDTVVIGKMVDLQAPGAIASGERTILDQLPNLGNDGANWLQNRRVLLNEMRTGNPIRDATVNLETGALANDTGFLARERFLLRENGWQYDSTTHLWSPGAG